MSRPSSRWLGHVATLGLGVALGLSLDRISQPLSAQPGTPPPAADRPEPLPGSDDDLYGRLARQYEQFRQVDRTFEQVARVVSPAVVHIVARKDGEDEDGRTARFEETGSGVIVRADDSEARYVLTNNHVVEGSRTEDITIYLHDGRVLRPALLWAEKTVDVAVLKLDRTDLPIARLGNSDEATVGTWVLAIGSPFGLTHSVSQGIISARSRYEAELEEDGVENQDFLQTDAAINPGNSGGPLVNLKGEVVGINTAIASNGGGSEGVGFSIPINLARWAMTQLVQTGRVSRGAIGVRLDALDAPRALRVGLDRPRGAWITSVEKATPAFEAGLRDGDVILRFNGLEVLDYNHLINLVSMSPIGEAAEVIVWRDRKSIALKIVIADYMAIRAKSPTLPERGDPRGLLRRPSRTEDPPDAGEDDGVGGLGLIPIDGPRSAQQYGLGGDLRGVLVTQVDPGGALAAVLRPFDLIESIAGRRVQSPDAVRRLLDGPHADPLEAVVLRAEGGALRRQAIRLP